MLRVQHMRLCYAAAEGDVTEVAGMLDGKCDPNLRDYDLRAPLHVAASHGHSEIVQELLKHRADVNATDHIGVTPLYEAQCRGHMSVEKALRQGGAHLSHDRLREQALRENWAISKEEVKLGDLLSETIKSQVFKGEWRGIQVVAKFAKVQGQTPSEDEDDEAVRTELLHEIELLAGLRHPDLVMFLGACLQDPTKVMFITELMEGGDLERYYMRKRRESGNIFVPALHLLLRWACAVARALSFLHGCRNPIIHRDLKPLNLLMTKHHKDVKVTDFGISKMTQRRSVCKTTTTGSKNPDTFVMTGGVGSWRYMAPEVVRYMNYNEKVDIYSFGLIIFFMSSGRDPFYEMSQQDGMLKEYLKGNEPRPKVTDCNKKLRDIMTAAWHPDPDKRPTADEITILLADVAMSTKCGCPAM